MSREKRVDSISEQIISKIICRAHYMNSLEQKMQDLKSFRYPKAFGGSADTAESFIDQIVLPQFGNREAIRQMHLELLDYVSSEAPVFFIRAYGSYKKEHYSMLRRGFLSQYRNGTKYAFCDNTFASLFASMKLSGRYFKCEEILEYFNRRKVVCGFMETTLERELASFEREGAVIPTLSQDKWYLAHIHAVGANYEGFLFSEMRDEYFPAGERKQWENDRKVRLIDREPSAQELALLKGHFIRLTHPLNNFVVPSKSILRYNEGTRIGEEPELIYKVRQRLKDLFEKEYAEMEACIFRQGPPLVKMPPLTDIKWGEGVNTEVKKTAKLPSPPLQRRATYRKHRAENFSDGLTVGQLLQKMGKEAFLHHFLALHSGEDIDYEKLAADFPNSRTWTTSSYRLSVAKSIFKRGLDLEALQIIRHSKRLRPELIQLAERYYDMLANEVEDSEG